VDPVFLHGHHLRALHIARILLFMKTTRWTVVTATGATMPMTKGRAETIARWLREGRCGNRKGLTKVACKVVPA